MYTFYMKILRMISMAFYRMGDKVRVFQYKSQPATGLD